MENNQATGVSQKTQTLSALFVLPCNCIKPKRVSHCFCTSKQKKLFKKSWFFLCSDN